MAFRTNHTDHQKQLVRGEDVETQKSFVTIAKFYYEDMKIFVLHSSTRVKNTQHSLPVNTKFTTACL